MTEWRAVVGSDTQSFEGVSFVTGVQRVVRESHVVMTDALAPHGIGLVPLHTRPAPRMSAFRRNPYLVADPVLEQSPVSPVDVDAFVFLDLNMHADFALVHREKRRRPRPVIGVVYDILPILHPEWWPLDPQRGFRMYVQQLLSVCDHVVVHSEKVRRDLLSLGWRIAGEVHVIPLGSTFRSRQPETRSDDRLSLLYVSTVEPRKGHDILLGAFDRLRASGLDVDLTLVGRKGWLSSAIADAMVRHPDFGGRLRWYEDADDVTAATLARASTVGVFPSQDEGFGLFLEEGLAQGLKMVASDIPVFRERAQENVYFADRTPDSFADAILGAHRAQWAAAGPVRSMRDFGYDMAELVRSALL